MHSGLADGRVPMHRAASQCHCGWGRPSLTGVCGAISFAGMAIWKQIALAGAVLVVGSYVVGMFLHKEIATEISIDGSAAQVWQHLVDFEKYPDWNPFIKKISGEPAVDGVLNASIGSPGGDVMDFSPRVLVFDENQEFRWRGVLGIPGLFDGEHYFRIEPGDGDSVRFVHGEQFTGILAVLAWGAIEPSTTQGFVAMNAALKARVEASRPTAIVAQ